MKSTTTSAARKGIDFKRIAQDFKGLDPNDPGLWPASPRVAVFIGLLVATIAAFWWFDWRDQVATLEQRQAEEVQLRESWVAKKRQAVNLEEHRRQLAEIDRQFGALLCGHRQMRQVLGQSLWLYLRITHRQATDSSRFRSGLVRS
mgnify:CR=1 FL=1